MTGGFLTPLWGNFVKQIGGDVRTAGIAICIFSIIIGICTILAARIENKYRIEKSALIFSAIIIALAYSGYLLVKTPFELYSVQLFLGIGCAIQTPALYKLYQDSMPAEKSTLGWGIWNGFFNIALGVAALCSSYIAHHLGLRGVFLVMLALACFSLFTSIWVVSRLQRDDCLNNGITTR